MSAAVATTEAPPFQPLAVVIADVGSRQQRHIVHCHEGGIVAFLCGRWKPAPDVMQSGDSRRSIHMCRTCHHAWERKRKEQSS